MRHAHSVQAVRAAESELMARLPEGALMQRAAAGLAAACAALLAGRGPVPAVRPGRGPGVYGARVVLLVGAGGNGGDALYAGARLARRGAGVAALLLAPGKAHRGGLTALAAAGGEIIETAEETATDPAYAAHWHHVERMLTRADLVVDGITGLGGRGGLRTGAARLAHAAEADKVPVVAVDLPSGIDADTGEVHGPAVTADLTVTFGTHKPGLLVDPAREHAGTVRLIDIGLDLPGPAAAEALQHADVAALLPRPAPESDKYRRGVVGICAGSARYPGAAVLCVHGALRTGAGAVRYAGPGDQAVVARFPETLVSSGLPSEAGRVQAWVVGPGLGEDEEAGRRVADVLAQDVPVLVDADGLRFLDRDRLRARTAPTLLTPHAGEAARLLGVEREHVEAARLTSVRRLASEYGATVLLKGSTTLVAAPDESMPVRVNATGTPWLATAGSGDVLSGVAGSLLAAGLSARDAASAGAYLHGLAARHAAAGAPVDAQDVAGALPAAWRDVKRG
ncbi:NAD(P)H-hydrate dehydratase [Streptomyces diastaticus]|uniref:NAD(P)H-hydrate dehydratase n=1 Tax=Streptomyces diastaticus TaxID=1956 RepID=UPI00382E1F20